MRKLPLGVELAVKIASFACAGNISQHHYYNLALAELNDTVGRNRGDLPMGGLEVHKTSQYGWGAAVG